MAPVPCSATQTVNIGHVEDIQELSSARLMEIPHRYIRDVGERPKLAKTPSSMHIPVIDMSKIVDGSQEESQIEMAKLATSCQEWGFFQVVNHGIERRVLEGIEKVAGEFFMLPLEEKDKYPMAPGTVQGYGHAFIFSEEQKLDWCNMMALAVEPSCMRNPKLWPTKPAKFNDTLEMYSMNIRKLCRKLLKIIAGSLGLGSDAFNDMFGEAVQAVRMNYYPPCSRPDLVLGLSPHSDGSAITVLQQDTGSIGLQILKDSTWVPVHPIPGALVINIGDTIEVLTNGKYKSVEHRAVTDKEKDRLSVVTFYAPSYDVELGPLPQFIDQVHPCMYRRYNHGEYSRHYISNKLQGKKSLDFAKIQARI